MKLMRIALAQINPTVGDLDGNVSKITGHLQEAQRLEVDLMVFPELAVTGYPPEDLLLKSQFIDDNLHALKKIQESASDIATIVGFVDRREALYNAAALIYDRKIIDVYHKVYLPNYGVFDEYRYFRSGTRYPIYRIGSCWVGVNICEDIWHAEGPVHFQSRAGATVIININASPYHIGKGKLREEMLSARASENMVTLAYLNTVGGQDELVFDGQSLIIGPDGNVLVRGKQFEEDLIIADINPVDSVMRRSLTARQKSKMMKTGKVSVEKIVVPGKRLLRKEKLISPFVPAGHSGTLDTLEEVYSALMLGTSDYVAKNRFNGVVIGLSGGIDSALVSSVAVDALGAGNVNGLFMPSPYTSGESREDAHALAKNLGIRLREVPIHAIMDSYFGVLKKDFSGVPPDVTEENLQARIRGNILMAFSNKFGWLVLTTGNKSEMSVGYATLYGDMAGGFAVIKDVPKTMVYQLCTWKNDHAGRIVIPERMFTKAPTAELKAGQKDTDTLPPYSVLDPILKAYIEEDRTFDEILSFGYDIEGTRKVIRMIDSSEYKRRQSPPGIKITQKAFGRDRRFPITNRYRGF
jgi:NAD+ synthase (glutamine-hydrolysing)